MKKILTAIALMSISLSGMAQTEYSVLRACHPDDVKHYDTKQLRSHFMMPKVMEQNKINLTYSMYDRLIYGGVSPCLLYTSPSPRDKRQSRMTAYA